jgi:type II secretory pathway component PulF
VFGVIIYMATIARYARTLATTFAAGVPLVDALLAVAGALDSSGPSALIFVSLHNYPFHIKIS